MYESPKDFESPKESKTSKELEPSKDFTLVHKPDERELASFGDGAYSEYRDNVSRLEKSFETVQIDPLSKLLFELSNDNVAFVGVYDEVTNRLYLHPLVPWIGNDLYDTKDFALNSINKEIVNSMLSDYAKKSENFSKFEPIKHVQGTNPSHKQICALHGLDPKNCVAFSVTKNTNFEHTFSAQSVSVNRPKFKQSSSDEAAKRQDGYVPIEYVQFLMSSLKKNMPKQISDCDFGSGVRNRNLFTLRPKPIATTATINIMQKDPKDLEVSKRNNCCR